jgi:hypothetical protein
MAACIAATLSGGSSACGATAGGSASYTTLSKMRTQRRLNHDPYSGCMLRCDVGSGAQRPAACPIACAAIQPSGLLRCDVFLLTKMARGGATARSAKDDEARSLAPLRIASAQYTSRGSSMPASHAGLSRQRRRNGCHNLRVLPMSTHSAPPCAGAAVVMRALAACTLLFALYLQMGVRPGRMRQDAIPHNAVTGDNIRACPRLGCPRDREQLNRTSLEPRA